MQATTVQAQASPAQVAHDLATLVLYALKASGSDFFRTMAELDLSVTQVVALNVLEMEAGTAEFPVKALADRLSVSLPTASRTVDLLHRRGYAERREDERDRRMKQVRITPAGREVTARIQGARLAALEQFVSGLAAEDRDRLAAAIGPIVARAEVGACRPSRPAPPAETG